MSVFLPSLAPRRLARGLLVLAPAVLFLLGGCASSSKNTIGAADTPQVYRANCISCHGTELQGRMGAATNLTKVGSRLSQEQITKQIKQGSDSMQGFSGRLTESEIQTLASWLSSKK